MRLAIRTDKAPAPRNRLSQAIQVGNFIFTAGIVGSDPVTGAVVSGGTRAQVRQTLENIKSILEAAGASLDSIVKVNGYLRDIADFATFNEVYNDYVGSELPPARTLLQVGGFPDEIAVEIEVVAVTADV